MTIPDDLSIERLALAVMDRTLPKKAWTHEAHFAVALWLLRNRPDLTAPDTFRTLIVGYNDATHTANTDTAGYHHTISRASIGAASSILRDHGPDAPLHVVLGALMASPLGRPDWLLPYWHRETLFSIAARRRWVDPDRARLPF